ncbi:E3 ubiquitin-protein ligase UHRF1 [Grifola frondosa]|uniref:E3 ubiquitin-protein ligase UHRF1 n=1 Tax=Grifola frondosa TaxID=5627 RepID=A0A1C7M6F7_GRIFR|nr:E3 ubiquitin-protein ligase UHRF1 [Grifola frondosa]
MGFSSKPTIQRTEDAYVSHLEPVSILTVAISAVFGHIPGVPVGETFENRLFLHHSAVHSGIMQGIYGSKNEGAYSVVLSGGYADDEDKGYRFSYTGCGGHDKSTRMGPQIADQSFGNPRNKALLVSSTTGRPVRVVRGYSSHSDFAPAYGYRYDGLYRVVKAELVTGKSGFKVCKFEFVRDEGQPQIPRREGTLNLKLPKAKPKFDKHRQPPKSKPLARPKSRLIYRPKFSLIRGPKESDYEDSSDDAEDNNTESGKRRKLMHELFSDSDDEFDQWLQTPGAGPSSSRRSIGMQTEPTSYIEEVHVGHEAYSSPTVDVSTVSSSAFQPLVELHEANKAGGKLPRSVRHRELATALPAVKVESGHKV